MKRYIKSSTQTQDAVRRLGEMFFNVTGHSSPDKYLDLFLEDEVFTDGENYFAIYWEDRFWALDTEDLKRVPVELNDDDLWDWVCDNYVEYQPGDLGEHELPERFEAIGRKYGFVNDGPGYY